MGADVLDHQMLARKSLDARKGELIRWRAANTIAESIEAQDRVLAIEFER
jgi:hypothetical protein